jgi:hypothetical protein
MLRRLLAHPWPKLLMTTDIRHDFGHITENRAGGRFVVGDADNGFREKFAVADVENDGASHDKCY